MGLADVSEIQSYCCDLQIDYLSNKLMVVSESASSGQPFQPVLDYEPPVVLASRWNM
jgi:hypothetical protein